MSDIDRLSTICDLHYMRSFLIFLLVSSFQPFADSHLHSMAFAEGRHFAAFLRGRRRQTDRSRREPTAEGHFIIHRLRDASHDAMPRCHHAAAAR